jgi:hypothetical protein
MGYARFSWIAATLLVAGAARGADPQALQEGKKAFTAGVVFLQDPDGAKYDEAFTQFKKAYALTGNWKVLGNLGLCSFKLERDGEAIEYYEKYLAGGGNDIDKDERQQVEKDLLAIKSRVVKVHLEFPRAGIKVTDERVDARGNRILNDYEATAATLDIGAHHGHHVLIARFPEGNARWEVDLVPGTAATHKFEPTKANMEAKATGDSGLPRKSANAMRLGGFIGLGIGAVGLGVGTVFVLRSHSKRTEAQDLCPGDPGSMCAISKQETYTQLQSDSNSAGTIGVIGLVAGGVAAAAGVTLLILGKKSDSTTGAVPAPALSAWVGPASAGVAGTF